MSKGSKEIDRMFNKLNSLIDKAKDIKERVKRKWEGEFHTSFVSYDIPNFLEEIEFFQNKYDFNKNLKIDTESVLRDISEKYSTKEREIERTEEPGFLDRVKYVISEEKGPEPETKKYIMTETYGKFISDPQEIFSSLLMELMSMYHYCLQKYTPPELDVGEINILNFLKLRFLKNRKSTILYIFIGIFLYALLAFLAGLTSNLF